MSNPPGPSGPDDTQYSLASGQVLDGRYRLGPMLGRGGMGAVYQAYDLRLERAVAVKVLGGSEAADEARFAGEVRALARFAHPNLVRLLDVGEVSQRSYLVMELVQGPTLGQRLSDERLSDEEGAAVASGIASALAYVHGQGVVHRDVKPANILLGQDGTAYLADFGIARLVDTTGMTVTGTTLGTPAYLAPEQVLGREVRPAADVYALGLVLIEALSGQRAFEGTPAEVTAMRIQRAPALPSNISPGWRAVLAAMTALRPQDRPSAAQVVEQVALARRRGWAVAAPATMPPTVRAEAPVAGPGGRTEVLPTVPPVVTRASPSPLAQPRRRWWPAAVAVLAGLVVVAGTVVALEDGSGRAPGRTGTATSTRPPATSSAPVVPRHRTTTSAMASTTTSLAMTTTSATTTTEVTTTSVTSTTSTSAGPVASAASGAITALTAATSDGGVTGAAFLSLQSELEHVLAAKSGSDQQSNDFGAFVSSLQSDVADGDVSASALKTLTGPVDALAAALGASTPSFTVPTPSTTSVTTTSAAVAGTTTTLPFTTAS